MITHYYEPFISGNRLSKYMAYMLSYSVGPVSVSDGYTKPPGRVFPVKLKPQIGLRKISLTFDFEGSSDREIALHISTMTKDLMNDASLFLPDGFWYWAAFDSATVPKVKAPWIQQVTFNLHGVRHGQYETAILGNSGVVYGGGNIDSPCVVTLTPIPGASSMTYNDIVLNVSTKAVIDGINGTVMNASGENIFGSTNILKWPVLAPGANQISISNVQEVEIGCYPIYV